MPKTLNFVSKGKPDLLKKATTDGKIDDHGTLGGLDYELYTRGVLHIKDKNGLCFKKDPDHFEEAIEDINFDAMVEDEETVIEGSGDNDNLVLTVKDGEIIMSLRKKEFKVIRKLRELINRGKKNKANKK